MFQPSLLLQKLLEHEVAFVVVGGIAAVAHGASIVTADLDLCYDPLADNRRRLVSALTPLRPYLRGAPSGLPFFWDERTLRDTPLLTLTTDYGDVDLLAEVAGVGAFAAVKAQSEVFEVLGLAVPVLGLEGLIAAKRAAGRPKDLILLPQLEALRALRDEEPPPA